MQDICAMGFSRWLLRMKWKIIRNVNQRVILIGFVVIFFFFVAYEINLHESQPALTLADESKLRQEIYLSRYKEHLERKKKRESQINHDAEEVKESNPIDESDLLLRIPASSFDQRRIPYNFAQEVKEELVDLKYPSKLSLGVEKPAYDVESNVGGFQLDKGNLEGGAAHCRLYNHHKDINDTFDCVDVKVYPTIQLCLYPNEEDIHLSRHIREEGIWERHLVILFQERLSEDPELGFIDIGANIGQYSLVAAKMGHPVVAVEPFLPNLKRFHRAIQLSGVEDQITVVQNAISNVRESVELQTFADNQGGVSLTKEFADPWCEGSICPPQTHTIFMDDLLEVTNFDKAIIKIDIEGHEHKAFIKSGKFLQNVFVPYIFMEWIKLREYYGSDAHESVDKSLVTEFVKYLTDNGYHAYSSVTGDLLKVDYWYSWTDDIIWKHNSVDYVD